MGPSDSTGSAPRNRWAPTAFPINVALGSVGPLFHTFFFFCLLSVPSIPRDILSFRYLAGMSNGE